MIWDVWFFAWKVGMPSRNPTWKTAPVFFQAGHGVALFFLEPLEAHHWWIVPPFWIVVLMVYHIPIFGDPWMTPNTTSSLARKDYQQNAAHEGKVLSLLRLRRGTTEESVWVAQKRRYPPVLSNMAVCFQLLHLEIYSRFDSPIKKPIC